MTYRVVVLPRAAVQLYQAGLWWAENRSAEEASRWLVGFETAIKSLAAHPEKQSVAREDTLYEFPFTIRQLLYGLGSRPTVLAPSLAHSGSWATEKLHSASSPQVMARQVPIHARATATRCLSHVFGRTRWLAATRCAKMDRSLKAGRRLRSKTCSYRLGRNSGSG